MTDRTISHTSPAVLAPPSSSSSVPTTNTTSSDIKNSTGNTTLSMGIMILVLGSSAGMMFYTKRTGSMLKSLQTISERPLNINQTKLRMYGPATKQDTEKMRPKIEKDEFF